MIKDQRVPNLSITLGAVMQAMILITALTPNQKVNSFMLSCKRSMRITGAEVT
ncbi:Uncharacterised protein [Vibrio cholerae]|nr:Uncharacterised protein [Vibrio cholerae]